MKQLQNNYTTVEQSKRLLELGVPVDSADCYYLAGEKCPRWLGIPFYKKCIEISLSDTNCKNAQKNLQNFKETKIIPCWSVGRLIEIYDICRCYDGDWDEVYGKETYIETYVSAIEEAILDDMLDFSKLED